jgi:hypothetical protein
MVIHLIPQISQVTKLTKCKGCGVAWVVGEDCCTSCTVDVSSNIQSQVHMHTEPNGRMTVTLLTSDPDYYHYLSSLWPREKAVLHNILTYMWLVHSKRKLHRYSYIYISKDACDGKYHAIKECLQAYSFHTLELVDQTQHGCTIRINTRSNKVLNIVVNQSDASLRQGGDIWQVTHKDSSRQRATLSQA